MGKLDRDPNRLVHKQFDVVIIGGGIFGAATAWEAASRGLSVALLEKADFAHATSSNHFKMVHGGIRYLQHMDIPRIRESAHERSALLRIAPHLVRPLPIVIPTYGNGIKGKGFVGTGMGIYDILTYDRNRGVKGTNRIPAGSFLSRKEVLKAFPGIHPDRLTGGALFYDGQMTSPARLVISFIRSAARAGATVCNYIKVTDFIRTHDRISGVAAIDRETGEELAIEGRIVINTAGPWAPRLLEMHPDIRISPPPTFSRDLAFVVPRKFSHPMAIAFATKSQDSDSIVDRGGRHLFAVPWRDKTLIGVWHKVYKRSPDRIEVRKSEIQNFVNEVNCGYPGLALTLDDVSLINTGLTLYGDENEQGSNTMSFGKRSLLIDHEQEHNVKGLISLIGVRATTARGMAEKAVNRVFARIDKPYTKSRTDWTPLFGGEVPDIQDLLTASQEGLGNMLPAGKITYLISLYGSQIPRIVRYGLNNGDLLQSIGTTQTLPSEVIHAVKEEMAIHLEDVLFRRVELSTSMLPADDVLMECAAIMKPLLGWDDATTASEIARAKTKFPNFNFKFDDEAAA